VWVKLPCLEHTILLPNNLTKREVSRCVSVTVDDTLLNSLLSEFCLLPWIENRQLLCCSLSADLGAGTQVGAPGDQTDTGGVLGCMCGVVWCMCVMMCVM